MNTTKRENLWEDDFQYKMALIMYKVPPLKDTFGSVQN